MKNETEFPEREIREALRPMRPERDAFEAKVRRKLEERKKAAEGQESSLALSVDPRDDGFLRKAAAILPPGIFIDSPIPAAAMASGQGGGAKGLFQGLLFLLSLPWVFVFAMLGTMLVSGKAMGKLRADPVIPNPQETRAQLHDWWKAKRIPGLLTLLVIGIAFFFQPVETLVFLSLVSMLALVCILRKLSHLGIANKVFVGEICITVLIWLGVFGFVTNQMLEPFLARQGLFLPNLHWCYFAFLAGAMLILFQTHRLKERYVWIQSLLMIPVVLMSLGSAIREPATSPAKLRQFLEDFSHEENIYSWDPFERTANWVSQVEGDASLKNSSLARSIREKVLSNDSPDHRDLDRMAAAAKLGWLEGELHENPLALEYLKELRVALSRKHATSFFHAWVEKLAIVIASDLLSVEEKSALADLALKEWPEPTETLSLQHMRNLSEIVESLGAGARLHEKRATVHEALRSCWAPTEFSLFPAGGVASKPGDGSYSKATHDAVDLMLRFGVPEGVDIVRVRNYLYMTSRPQFFQGRLSQHNLPETLALAKLQTKLLPQENTVSDWVVRNRLLLASLALVFLASLATGRAPKAEMTPSFYSIMGPKIESFDRFLRKAQRQFLYFLALQIGAIAFLWILRGSIERIGTSPSEASPHAIEWISLAAFLPIPFLGKLQSWMEGFLAANWGEKNVQVRLLAYLQSRITVLSFLIHPLFVWNMGLRGSTLWDASSLGVTTVVFLATVLLFPTRRRIEKAIGAPREQIDEEIRGPQKDG